MLPITLFLIHHKWGNRIFALRQIQIFPVYIFTAMGNINFKISFKISKSVNTDAAVLRANILELLKREEYEIIVNNDINIGFNNSGGPIFRVRDASASRLQEGNFTLIKENDNTLVRLDFRIPFLSWLIGFVTFLFVGFSLGWGVLYLIGFLIATFIFDIALQKNSAKVMVNSITETQ